MITINKADDLVILSYVVQAGFFLPFINHNVRRYGWYNMETESETKPATTPSETFTSGSQTATDSEFTILIKSQQPEDCLKTEAIHRLDEDFTNIRDDKICREQMENLISEKYILKAH
jgi:hypothetical protein